MAILYAVIASSPSALIILLTAVIPTIMTSLAHLVGFETLSNMILCALILMLMFITLVLTIIVAGQTTKIRMLIQEISILKEAFGPDWESACNFEESNDHFYCSDEMITVGVQPYYGNTYVISNDRSWKCTVGDASSTGEAYCHNY